MSITIAQDFSPDIQWPGTPFPENIGFEAVEELVVNALRKHIDLGGKP
jgi:hypothetical protein